MNSSLTDFSPDFDPTLPSLGGLSLRDVGLTLLRRIAFLPGKTFRRFDLSRGTRHGADPNGLAPAIPRWEVQSYIRYLLDSPWRWILDNGYIAESSPGSEWMEVTPKGWAVLGINSDDDDYIFKIFPEDRARWSAEHEPVHNDAEAIPVPD
jgi:hypothetical protein